MQTDVNTPQKDMPDVRGITSQWGEELKAGFYPFFHCSCSQALEAAVQGSRGVTIPGAVQEESGPGDVV